MRTEKDEPVRTDSDGEETEDTRTINPEKNLDDILKILEEEEEKLKNQDHEPENDEKANAEHQEQRTDIKEPRRRDRDEEGEGEENDTKEKGEGEENDITELKSGNDDEEGECEETEGEQQKNIHEMYSPEMTINSLYNVKSGERERDKIKGRAEGDVHPQGPAQRRAEHQHCPPEEGESDEHTQDLAQWQAEPYCNPVPKNPDQAEQKNIFNPDTCTTNSLNEEMNGQKYRLFGNNEVEDDQRDKIESGIELRKVRGTTRPGRLHDSFKFKFSKKYETDKVCVIKELHNRKEVVTSEECQAR